MGSASDWTESEEGDSTVGPYRLEHRLGGGGMAEVFLARQALSGGGERRCVVKRLWPNMVNDAELIEMFLDEARLAARLSHPNLVPIYDFGEHQGAHYISMEYVAGRTLGAILQEQVTRGTFIPFPVAARIISQVADALDYAHQAQDRFGRGLQVVHRDISPQNILVSTSGAVKLIDFGIAKSKAERLQTRVGYIKGKLNYMSPEQASARQLDARSDLYSLGLVLFELLTNAKPFLPKEDVSQMLEAVRQGQIEPLGKYREGIPEPLKDVVARVLQTERALRFQRAADLSFELERFILRHGVVVSAANLARLAGVDPFAEALVDAASEPVEDTARFLGPPEPTLVMPPAELAPIPPPGGTLMMGAPLEES